MDQNATKALNHPADDTIQSFDYIIIGAGCAGLSLLLRLLDHPSLAGKKILLADRSAKTQNDRTWCFWEQNPGYFESIVHHAWPALWVKHPNGQLSLKLSGYQYKMIRGIDFYRHAFARIRQASNVRLQFGEVSHVDAAGGLVTIGEARFKAHHIFSSVLLQPPVLQPGELYLLQHFRGWWMDTKEDVFDPGAADLMNFRTSQHHGCAFVYVLPVSKRRALVEYTLFTAEELTDQDYDEGLTSFVDRELALQPHQYTVSEIENGVIPMTNLKFPVQDGAITFIGTAGGQTKASTGYTFQYIQKHSAAIAEALATHKVMPPIGQPRRFRFYDSVLLRVLEEQKMPGADVFFKLFERNPASRVLRFLDNETNFGEELLLLNSTPKSIFVPAAFRERQRL